MISSSSVAESMGTIGNATHQIVEQLYPCFVILSCIAHDKTSLWYFVTSCLEKKKKYQGSKTSFFALVDFRATNMHDS
jgi:hypothetical protein